MRRLIPIILSLILSPNAGWGFCFEEAGQTYGISPEILYNIASVESGFNPYAVNKNKNGSYDYGLMQINSIWAKKLGTERWKALSDPCTNVMTGAWILSQCISSYGYTWRGIGCYNSRTPELNKIYARKIFASIVKHRKLATQTSLIASAKKPEELSEQGQITPWEEIISHDDSK